MKRFKNIILYVYRYILVSYKIYTWKKFLKHRKEILDGVKNYIVKRKNVEYIANFRFKICKQCKYYTNDDSYCVVSKTNPCCMICGCSLLLKTYSLSSSCPLNKWNSIVNEEIDIKLNY